MIKSIITFIKNSKQALDIQKLRKQTFIAKQFSYFKVWKLIQKMTEKDNTYIYKYNSKPSVAKNAFSTSS
jgi:1-deoxy-D-xylulose 5-phosphate reductoisomerase